MGGSHRFFFGRLSFFRYSIWLNIHKWNFLRIPFRVHITNIRVLIPNDRLILSDLNKYIYMYLDILILIPNSFCQCVYTTYSLLSLQEPSPTKPPHHSYLMAIHTTHLLHHTHLMALFCTHYAWVLILAPIYLFKFATTLCSYLQDAILSTFPALPRLWFEPCLSPYFTNQHKLNM